MINPTDADYCSDVVKSRHRDFFLQSLFLRPGLREKILALGALDAELRHVHQTVREELLGHMRYAWWQENISALPGTTDNGHPVLAALAGLPPDLSLEMLVDFYRDAYPAMPEQAESPLWVLASKAISLLDAAQLAPWERAGSVIRRHRRRYHGANGLLALRLLLTAFR